MADKDMYIDTNDYDVFSQLADDMEIVTTKQKAKPATAPVKQVEPEDDLDFDPISHSEDYDELEDESEEDSEDDYDDIDDEEEETEGPGEEEVVNDILQNFDSLDDDLIIRIGDKEITKAEASEILKTSESVKEQKSMIDTFVQQFDKERVLVEQTIYSSLSETALMKQNILNKLNSPECPQVEKGQLYDDLRKLEDRERVLNGRAAEYSQAFQRREDQAILFNVQNVDREMSKKYADWAEKRQELAAYIESTGVSSKPFLKAITPGLMESLLKAMKYDKVYAEKAKALKGKLSKKPGAVQALKGKPHTKQLKSSKSIRERELVRRIKSGKATEDDISKSFDFLID